MSDYEKIEILFKRLEVRLDALRNELREHREFVSQLDVKLDDLLDSPAPSIATTRPISTSVPSTVVKASEIAVLRVLANLGRPARCHEVQSMIPELGPGYKEAQKALQPLRPRGLVIYTPANATDYTMYEISDAGREYLELKTNA